MIALFRRVFGLDAPTIANLSPEETKARVSAGAILLDVRSSQERRTAKISGSRSIPLEQLSSTWETLPADLEIICQCASGMRSAQAARFLADKGLKASNLKGGIRAWQAAGLPVKKG